MRGWLTGIAVLALLILTGLVAGADSIELASYKQNPDIIEATRNSLSELFGFGRRKRKIDPSKVVIPEVMKQLYERISKKERDTVAMPKAGIYTKTANTVRSFVHQESEIDKRFSDKRRFRLHFDISSIPKEEILKAAELTLVREPVKDIKEEQSQEQVLVYDLQKPGVKGKSDPILLLVDSKRIDIREGGTVSLDVAPAIERWLKNPTENYGLIIKVVKRKKSQTKEHNHVRLRRSVNEEEKNWNTKQPVLYTYTDDGKYLQRTGDALVRNHRSKREKRKRKNGREICHRKPLYVDFSDVGWNDWIVAPPGYDAYYCHGDCPFPLADHLNSTNHAIVQNLVNGVNPSAVPKACCVPTTLSSISMLYLDEENKVVLKNYQDMSVVGCGCR